MQNFEVSSKVVVSGRDFPFRGKCELDTDNSRLSLKENLKSEHVQINWPIHTVRFDAMRHDSFVASGLAV